MSTLARLLIYVNHIPRCVPVVQVNQYTHYTGMAVRSKDNTKISERRRTALGDVLDWLSDPLS